MGARCRTAGMLCRLFPSCGSKDAGARHIEQTAGGSQGSVLNAIVAEEGGQKRLPRRVVALPVVRIVHIFLHGVQGLVVEGPSQLAGDVQFRQGVCRGQARFPRREGVMVAGADGVMVAGAEGVTVAGAEGVTVAGGLSGSAGGAFSGSSYLRMSSRVSTALPERRTSMMGAKGFCRGVSGLSSYLRMSSRVSTALPELMTSMMVPKTDGVSCVWAGGVFVAVSSAKDADAGIRHRQRASRRAR